MPSEVFSKTLLIMLVCPLLLASCAQQKPEPMEIKQYMDGSNPKNKTSINQAVVDMPFPNYPNPKRQAVFGVGKGELMQMMTDDPPAKVAEFYKKILERDKWTITKSTEDAVKGSWVWRAEKGGKATTITIMPNSYEKATAVSITYSPEGKTH